MDVNECARKAYIAMAYQLAETDDTFRRIVDDNSVNGADCLEYFLSDIEIREPEQMVIVNFPQRNIRAYGFDLSEGRKHYESWQKKLEFGENMSEEAKSGLATILGEYIVIDEVGTIVTTMSG